MNSFIKTKEWRFHRTGESTLIMENDEQDY